MKAFEVNFDGLVGPTHNYAGLSFGNVASTANRSNPSNPRDAALQGLAKMKRLHDLGFKQGVLPPQERPSVATLRALGFRGADHEVIVSASKKAPEILAALGSASCMWTANAATVSPSADSSDGRVHFTAANLVSKFHRWIEGGTTASVLRQIFADPKHFTHHDPLPSVAQFGDEGAANHTRLCADYGRPGIEFFVYGKRAFGPEPLQPAKFPARQTFEASSAIARRHLLDDEKVVYAQQNPAAIDAGVFHNDVAGVGNCDVYFYHQEAYVDGSSAIAELSRAFKRVCGKELRLIEVASSEVSLSDAVRSYLFNSQLLSLPQGGAALVLPEECRETPSVARYLEKLKTHHGDLFKEFYYFDLKQSMRNGGGPACLRLRVVLNEAELEATHAGVLMTDKLYDDLVAWVKKHYRDRLLPEDLSDPQLLDECRAALSGLSSVLQLTL